MNAHWKTLATILCMWVCIWADGFAQSTASSAIYPHLGDLREKYQHDFYPNVNLVKVYQAMDTSRSVLKTLKKGEGYRLIIVEDNDWLRVQIAHEENKRETGYLRWIDTKQDLTVFQAKKTHPQNLQMVWAQPKKANKKASDWIVDLTIVNDHPLRDYAFKNGYLSIMLVNESDTLLHFLKLVSPFHISEKNQQHDVKVTDRVVLEKGYIFYSRDQKGIFYKRSQEEEEEATLLFNHNSSKKNSLIAVYSDDQTISEPLFSTEVFIGQLNK